MRTMFLVLMLAATVNAQLPYLPIECNFERAGTQWHVRSKRGNTPVIRAYFYQGTNAWNAGGYDVVFKYAPRSSSAMYSVTGVVNGTYADFNVASNDFGFIGREWYAVVTVSSNNTRVSYSEGFLTVDPAPEFSGTTLSAPLSVVNLDLLSWIGSLSGAPWQPKATNSPTSGYVLQATGTGLTEVAWLPAAGGGDMLTSVYDQDVDGKVDSAAVDPAVTNAAVTEAVRASTNLVAQVGYLTEESDTNALAQLAAHTGATANAHALSAIGNPTDNHTITMGGNTLEWVFTNPNGGWLTRMTGGWSGHVWEILDQANGDGAGGDHLAHIETERLNVIPLHVVHGHASGLAFKVDGAARINGQLVVSNDVTAANGAVSLTNAHALASSAVLQATNSVRGALAGWAGEIGLATNAGTAGAGYYAMSNGVWTAFAPGEGGGIDASTWSQYQATQNVDMNSYEIRNVNKIHAQNDLHLGSGTLTIYFDEQNLRAYAGTYFEGLAGIGFGPGGYLEAMNYMTGIVVSGTSDGRDGLGQLAASTRYVEEAITNRGLAVAAAVVPTNRTLTINGQAAALDTNVAFTVVGGDGISAETATNIAETVLAAWTNGAVLMGGGDSAALELRSESENPAVLMFVGPGLDKTNLMTLANGRILVGGEGSDYVMVDPYVQTNDATYLGTLTNISVNGQQGTVADGVASVNLAGPGSAITNLLFWTGSSNAYAALSATNSSTIYFVTP